MGENEWTEVLVRRGNAVGEGQRVAQRKVGGRKWVGERGREKMIDGGKRETGQREG